MIVVQTYGAINQDAQQFGLRMWSWSGGAGAAVAQTYGPGHFSELFVIHPGFKELDIIHPGFEELELAHSGFKEVEVHW